MKQWVGRIVGSTVIVAVGAVLVACAAGNQNQAAAPVVRAYDAREESTAITNLAVVSPDNLYVWNVPSFADDKSLVYSAKQWDAGQLNNLVSVWRSPSVGGAATKLLAAGDNEALVTSRTSPRSKNVYMSVNCSLFSASKSGVGGRRKYPGTGYCDYAATPFPDESRIMFTSCAPNTDCYWRDSNYIWLVNPDGTNMIQLRQGHSTTLSPDGRTIAFTYGGDLWTMRIDGSEATNMTASSGSSEDDAAFSNDGKKLYFTRRVKNAQGQYGNGDIWMMNLDGTEQVQLTVSPAHDWAPSAAPDGFIYFLTNRGALVGGQNPMRVWRMQVVEAK